MKLPILYKKTNIGAIQYWKIWTEISNQGFNLYPTIVIEYGQLGTDSPQETFEHIKEGKNVGKKNETTAEEQANKEAKARWEKQKKKGYVESIEAAEEELVDEIVKGGINPMLAHSFDKHEDKIKFLCYGQPKMDGIRCIAIVKNSKCTLWSRSRKQIISLPHIEKHLEWMASKYGEGFILDGELYNHQFKDNFEHIVSLVRQEEPDPRHTDVEYHVYDVAMEGPFEHRLLTIDKIFQSFLPLQSKFIKQVYTRPIPDKNFVKIFYNDCMKRGFEGTMLRNAQGLYVNKRSYDLQKVKEFTDGEFEIIGIEEGRGKLAGHVGAFRCRTKEGKEFLAKMSGDTGKLRDYFEKHELWKGKFLTVQYQGLTGAEGVPRFPIGKIIRDYE